MTDLEYDVIDELYFVTAYPELAQKFSIGQEQLQAILKNLVLKGWVKCLKTVSEELIFNEKEFDKRFLDYFYLATKAGLLAHNSTD